MSHSTHSTHSTPRPWTRDRTRPTVVNGADHRPVARCLVEHRRDKECMANAAMIEASAEAERIIRCIASRFAHHSPIDPSYPLDDATIAEAVKAYMEKVGE